MAGDSDFSEYVAARWHGLVRSAVLLGCTRAEAEDLVQTTLERCLVKWGKVREADDLDAYVHRVLINVFISARRRWTGEKPVSDLPERADDDETAGVDDTDAVMRALDRLGTDQRTAVVLRYYAHLTDPQIASVLGVAVGTSEEPTVPSSEGTRGGPRPGRTARNTMIESKVTELLERAGERTHVGPPPIEAIRVGAARRRRRRAGALSAVGMAAAVVAVGGTLLLAGGPSFTDPAPPAASTPPVPGATRLVGIGHAAIAVPTQWGTNQLGCGTPLKDTVIIDAGPQNLCAIDRPKGVESVFVRSGKPIGFRADETFQLDGVRAERQRATCTGDSPLTVCSGTVFIPSLDVAFQAESSTNAGEVHGILARIMIVPDTVGVPEPRFSESNPAARFSEQYADRLTALGLKPNIQTRKSPGSIPGTILAVSPLPGTMLMPGATVLVAIAQP